ncbi:Na(+)/H(+) exchanger beta [Aduncisulcus paluster]|uniref:Sodium/hydrogen exchanger n=2 Tax=Aduncisulcus paluster TaxID=2918883 RepID=A0ABQ5KJP4_9EUKA|nr:Na(+)/H(+) exchanger beta [Aduncisulcus paluster]
MFFAVLIPPIILQEGFHMRKDYFFGNLGTILVFALIGTLLNTFITGGLLFLVMNAGFTEIQLNMLQCLAFGAVISAVDPIAVLSIFDEVHVNDTLGMVLSGESVLNDAISIVLYNVFKGMAEDGHVSVASGFLAVAKFVIVACGGLIVGLIFGLISALLIKIEGIPRHIEPFFLILFAYTSYLMAEIFSLSGIVSILTCGIIMDHYTKKNLFDSCRTASEIMLKMLSSISETFVFFMLGMSLSSSGVIWDWKYIWWTILFITVSRFVVVPFLSLFVNKMRLQPISLKEQFILCYGGLRGAIAFALTLTLEAEVFGGEDNKDMIIACALFVVMFTVFLQGSTIKPILKGLDINLKKSVGKGQSLAFKTLTRALPMLVSTGEGMLGTSNKFGKWFSRMDKKYFQRWFCKVPPDDEADLLEELEITVHHTIYEHLRKGVASSTSASVVSSAHITPRASIEILGSEGIFNRRSIDAERSRSREDLLHDKRDGSIGLDDVSLHASEREQEMQAIRQGEIVGKSDGHISEAARRKFELEVESHLSEPHLSRSHSESEEIAEKMLHRSRAMDEESSKPVGNTVGFNFILGARTQPQSAFSGGSGVRMPCPRMLQEMTHYHDRTVGIHLEEDEI